MCIGALSDSARHLLLKVHQEVALPSPACVRWWGEVNWAVGTAVNVYSVKANTAMVIITQNPHLMTFPPNTRDFFLPHRESNIVPSFLLLVLTLRKNSVMSLWSYCKHDVLYLFLISANQLAVYSSYASISLFFKYKMNQKENQRWREQYR